MTQLSTTEIRQLIERGERPAARQQLMQFVRATGAATSGEVWWLLAQTLDDPAQQADCLARAAAAGYVPPPKTPPPAEEPPALAWELPAEEPPALAWELPPAPAAPPELKPAKARRVERQAAVAAPPRYPPDQVEFVIGQFAKHENRYEMTQQIMAAYGRSYTDAQDLIAYVEAAHGTTIAKKQLPLILILSIAGIIGGTYLLLSTFGLVSGSGRSLAGLISPRTLVRIGAGLSAVGSGLAGLVYGLLALRGKR